MISMRVLQNLSQPKFTPIKYPKFHKFLNPLKTSENNSFLFLPIQNTRICLYIRPYNCVPIIISNAFIRIRILYCRHPLRHLYRTNPHFLFLVSRWPLYSYWEFVTRDQRTLDQEKNHGRHLDTSLRGCGVNEECRQG